MDPIRWKFEAKKIDSKKYEVVFKATIDAGWHLYSTTLPEGGPIPTSFNFSNPQGYQLVGSIKEMDKAKKEHDEIFDMDVTYFDGTATFVQEVELTAEANTTASGTIEYQACFEDKCLFLEKDFSVSLGDFKAAAVAEKKPVEKTSEPAKEEESSSLLVFFFISFAAGLAGLLTPCVFPMIPMTVSFFMNKQGNKLNAIVNALVFGLSIIVIYTGIGFLVSLTSMGASFANDITSHWITNAIFFTLFIVFAASFFGLFEIVLPGNLANKTDSKADKGGFIGSFFMALTTVIVSLSCVGPIVGSILVEAAAGIGAKPIIGMFGFSLAFSIPFTLFAIFPSWLNALPKSGGWMNSVKVVLGFIVLAFSLKFLMVIDQNYHWGFLTREVYLSIWIAIFLLLGLYLLGKIRFEMDSEVKHIGFFRMLMAVASFSFMIYLVPGLFGAPLSGISGLLPSRASHKFDLATMISQASLNSGKVSDKKALCEEPKYADFLHLPHGLQGYFDYEQALACAREQNKPLFIDFVGHSCSNCKEMEEKVWSDPRVLERLRNDFIIVALYVDERFELPENEWVTSTVDGKVKKTIGKKNSDFQISRFNMNGQPYYVILGNGEQVLTDPFGYNTDTEAFIEFLDKGKAAFSAGLNSKVTISGSM
jgi:thiol:disulfide interchange protein DsbD